MLSLAGPQVPASTEELATALRDGFQQQGLTPAEVRAEGSWPRLTRLFIDLTGAHFSRDMPLPKPGTDPEPGVFLESLTVSASPLFLEKTPVQFHLHASEAEGVFAQNSDGLLLQLVRTGPGSFSLEISRTDLETALKTVAQGILSKQGADVKAARLELIDRGPHSLGFTAEITAKAFVMTARVTVTGQLDLDDQLNLRISRLASSGDGMVASVASGFLRPRFAEIQERTFALAAYSFAGVTPHEVRISGGESLRIEAQFGR